MNGDLSLFCFEIYHTFGAIGNAVISSFLCLVTDKIEVAATGAPSWVLPFHEIIPSIRSSYLRYIQ